MKVSRIRVGFQVALHVALISHVLAYYLLGWTSMGALDFQSFFHDLLGEGLLTAGAILTLAAFLLTLVLGRIFCSWGCHFGATQDAAAWILRKLHWKPPFVRTRFLHWFPYVILLVVFLLPPLGRLLEGRVPQSLAVDLAANPPWATLPGWAGTLVTFAACGAGILLFLGTRGFCRFVCPYGAVFRVLDPVSPYRVRKVKPCSASCGDGASAPCTVACPTAVAVHEEAARHGAVRDRDCVRCHLCIEACPQQALSYALRASPAPREARDGGMVTELPVRPAAMPAVVPAAPSTATLQSGVPAKTRFAMPLWKEIVVAAVTGVAFVAWDLTIAAHFLAATLALGEGFLALLTLEILGRRDLRLGPVRLKSSGRWTFAGATVAGLFLLSLVPLVQGVSFKALRFVADDHFDRVFPPALGRRVDEPRSTEAQLDLATIAAPDVQAATERRLRLENAERAYRAALGLFPAHYPTLRKYVVVLAALGDRRALDVAAELARNDPDDRSAALLAWVESRFDP